VIDIQVKSWGGLLSGDGRTLHHSEAIVGGRRRIRRENPNGAIQAFLRISKVRWFRLSRQVNSAGGEEWEFSRSRDRRGVLMPSPDKKSPREHT